MIHNRVIYMTYLDVQCIELNAFTKHEKNVLFSLRHWNEYF